MDVLLGLDLGTTNTKCVAYALDGRPLAEASRPTPTRQEGLRRASHDPEALWQEAATVMRQTVTNLPGIAQVMGLAVASVAEAGVPLDVHGEPLYPIIAWHDARTVPQAAWWSHELGEEAVYRRTGLPLGHIFTLNKLMWLRDEEPAVYARLRRWLCVSDYIAYRLTGEQAMGYSLASRTMALDLAGRRWSDAMLECAGIEAAILPPLAPEGTLVGRLTGEAAQATGLVAGTPVYVGGHDHVCGALAVGAYHPGIVLDSSGTTEAELITLESVEEYLRQPNLSFCLGAHVARGRYYAIGSILGAGSLLSWLANLLWPAAIASSAPGQALRLLTEAAATSPLGSRGLYVLPHLAGAGSPERNATARGVMVGLSLDHSNGDMARAVIEGLAFELRLLWESLEAFTCHPIVQAILIGGGARNMVWTQVKADVTGRTLHVPQHAEAVTRGAALLAGIGAGVYRDEDEAQERVRVSMNEVHPDAERAVRYAALYRVFIEQIRPLAAELGRRSGALSLRQT